MNYLQAFSDKAQMIANLTWALLSLSVDVVLIVAAQSVAHDEMGMDARGDHLDQSLVPSDRNPASRVSASI